MRWKPSASKCDSTPEGDAGSFAKNRTGARHALIGPNGAGKNTVINLLTGVLRPDAGHILLDGNDITSLPVHGRVLRGWPRTFQINQLNADLTMLVEGSPQQVAADPRVKAVYLGEGAQV